ncbi:MAG TPA: DegT/DnrJ/EryC1/StrS family aminotransferase [Candidatus Saccharimonadales bacterium]|nr:DegT/DnrJ/EryC1/StrS family aminotransferase [Candidatus Saccharimonadales bacterium]
MPVPLLDLKAQYATIKDEVLAAVHQVMEKGAFILGPEVKALEAEVAAYSQCKFGIGCASGTDALLLALKALDIGPGDEVIVPTFTFFATAGAVHNVGATPVFVDIEPDTWNLDPAGLERALTPRTRAVIPVHLYGQCADMDRILELCRPRGIAVIEDAAQSIGSEHRGRRAGSMGTLGCFSFFPSKNLGAMGDGGMVTVREDEALAERVRLLRSHGAKPKYFHKLVGTNSRLDELQAAILRVKLRHLDAWTAGRQKNARRYDELLRGVVTTPKALPHARHIYNQYVIQLEGRDALQTLLKERGIGHEIYYPLCLHQQECFAHLPSRNASLPAAERAAREVLALPVYPELPPESLQLVADAVQEFVKSKVSR